MSRGKQGAFGSRKGIPQPAVLVHNNTLQCATNPYPWFADFDSMAAQCEALITGAAVVLPYVQDVTLRGHVDPRKLNTDLETLNGHVSAFKGRLSIIRSETEQLRASVQKIKPDLLPGLLDHGEKFQLFMNDFTRIAMYAADTVLDHFRPYVEIPYTCPFHPGFTHAVTNHQMSAQQFEEATAPLTMGQMGDLVKEEDKQ